MKLDLSPTTGQSISFLRRKYADLKVQVEAPIEFPEPALRLEMESRNSDPVRIFKYLQQMCLLHTQGFISANQIKLVYVVDAYIQMVDSANPIGVYACARGLLEFNAFLFDVTKRLLAVSEGDAKHWRSRGEEYFGLIVRARFGTSDPSKAELLSSSGISKKHLKPFHISEAIKELSRESSFLDVALHYDLLCDFVHHNLSSQTVSNVGSFVSDTARSSGGGEILLKTPGPITRYQYPANSKAVKAIEETATIALRNVEGSIRWVNRCPESLFQRREIRNMTGTDFGLVEIPGLSVKPQVPRGTGRNDPCPCGSGKKFKRCCLNEKT